jgi:hypothetical protein
LVSLVTAAVVLSSCASTTSNVSAADLQKRQQALTASDHLIVPGQRIGPIRLGMGMDEVLATLGQPDNIRKDEINHLAGDQWYYWSLNMSVAFSRGSAPTVFSISTNCWGKSGSTLGTSYWADMEPIQTVFRTENGIGLGSTSFEVRRAYSSYSYEDSGGVWMDYKGLGLQFIVTNDQDHRIYTIYVK